MLSLYEMLCHSSSCACMRQIPLCRCAQVRPRAQKVIEIQHLHGRCLHHCKRVAAALLNRWTALGTCKCPLLVFASSSPNLLGKLKAPVSELPFILCMHGLQNHDQRASPQHHQSASASSPRHTPRPRSPLHQGFAEVAQQHLAAVVGQILRAEGAEDPEVWQPIVTRLALETAYAVLPSALAAFGVSDPRFYIKVCKPFHGSLCSCSCSRYSTGCLAVQSRALFARCSLAVPR